MIRRGLAWMAALAVGLAAGVASAAPAPAFDRAGWQADYRQLKAAMETGYVNLAWMGSPDSGIDLPALDRRAQADLARAATDEQARRALLDFVDSLHDGHFSQLPYLAKPTGPVEPEPADVALDPTNPVDGCAALGFVAVGAMGFSLPFDTLPGFHLTDDGLTSPFRTGIITDAGRKIGVIRIQRFQKTAFPSVCQTGWARLRAEGKPVTAETLGPALDAVWYDALAERLRALRAQGAALVLVDVGANPGGGDSGDWMLRMFTARTVSSARLRMVDAPVSAGYFDEQLGDVADALKQGPSERPRRLLDQAQAFFAGSKASLGKAHCDLSWVWTSRRPWRLEACNRIVDAGSAGGFMASPPADPWPDTGADAGTAAVLSWSAGVARDFGAWTGPVYVLTDARSYSAAEMFAAVMKDNGIARLVGVRTGGDGCGFMTDGEPLVLAHSRLRFRMPNCIRLRADGSNEVAGIAPDLPIGPVEGESNGARAAQVLKAIVADLAAPPAKP